MLTFNADGMVQQSFPFPAPIMAYIFKNLTAPQLLKLYQTCKFFYDKFRLNIIEHFEICDNEDDERIIGNSLAIWQQNSSLSKLKNLWISKSFTFFEDTDAEKAAYLEHTMFSRLSFAMLHLSGKYRLEDYEFLVKCLSLRHLIINGSIYYSKTGKNLSIEECIERAPHVSTIHLSLFDRNTHMFEAFPPVNMAKLLSLDCQTKLTSFHLRYLSEIPDPLLMVEFFKKTASPDIDYYFDFDDVVMDFDANNIKAFFNTINDGLRTWKLSYAIPPTMSSSFIDLNGKIAVITGASNDIGKATVILFRQLGATVIAVTRNQFQLKSLIDECQNIKNDGVLYTANFDITDLINGIEELGQMINYKFNAKIDILVLGADIMGIENIPNIYLEKEFWRDKHDILKNQQNLIQTVEPYLTVAKGTIIYVSTSHDLITKSERAASIAKLEQKLKIAELELALAGVRTNFVNPGTPPTTFSRPDAMTDADYKKYLRDSKKTYNLQCANAIAFLASDAAKLISGVTLPINALNLG